MECRTHKAAEPVRRLNGFRALANLQLKFETSKCLILKASRNVSQTTVFETFGEQDLRRALVVEDAVLSESATVSEAAAVYFL